MTRRSQAYMFWREKSRQKEQRANAKSLRREMRVIDERWSFRPLSGQGRWRWEFMNLQLNTGLKVTDLGLLQREREWDGEGAEDSPGLPRFKQREGEEPSVKL